MHPLFAVSSAVTAVLLSFGYFALIMLLPLIPAVIIYRLFPDGNVANAGGRFSGFTIKAAGAWGAYVTAFLLGLYGLKSSTQPLIARVCGRTVWTISADFRLEDRTGRPLNRQVSAFTVNNAYTVVQGNSAEITVITETGDPPSDLYVSLPAFEPVRLRLSKAFQNGPTKAEMPEPIVFRELPPFQPPAGPAPDKLPADAPAPAIVASNP